MLSQHAITISDNLSTRNLPIEFEERGGGGEDFIIKEIMTQDMCS